MSNNLRKAAVLLMTLPPDEAAGIISRLDPEMVEAVAVEIVRTEHVSAPERDAVAREFAATAPTIGDSGGLEVATALLRRALGDRAGQALDNVRRSLRRTPFDFLQRVDSQSLLRLFVDEHPQTVALVLSYLSPSQGAGILSGLPADQQLSVIGRLATLGPASREIVQEVEHALQSRLAVTASPPLYEAGNLVRAA